MATNGSCNLGCNKFPYLAIITFFLIWMTFMAAVPEVVATLRFIKPEERSLGLGLQTIVLRYVDPSQIMVNNPNRLMIIILLEFSI